MTQRPGWPSVTPFLVCVALLILGWRITAAQTSQETAATPTPLFSIVSSAQSQVAPPEPGERRRRLVNVDVASLGGSYGARPPHDRLAMTLFPTESFVAVLDRAETTTRGRSWIGHLEGIEASYVVLTVSSGLVAGSVGWPGGHMYQVSPVAGGLHAIIELDSAHDFDEAPPLTPPTDNRNYGLVTTEPIALDDPSAIDILFIYSPEVRQALGSDAGAAASVDHLVSMSNLTLANSGVRTQVRVVQMLEIPYGLPTSCAEMLGAIANPSDGYLDQVHPLRDAYGADLVYVLFPSGRLNCGGQAYYANRPEWARYGFGISAAYSFPYRILAHEIGHNLGAKHDWYMDDTPDSSHGYANCAAGWVDVMSYYDECTARGLRVSDIPYFSNPALSHNGARLGVPAWTSLSCRTGNLNNPPCDADAAGAIARSIAVVANFRTSRYVTTNFPPGNETFDFRAMLEAKYRDGLRFAAGGTHADIVGAAVWMQEYLRYRVGRCSHEVAADKVRRLVLGRGIAELCGSGDSAPVVFPPRNETHAFRLELERIYRDVLKWPQSQTYVDLEGDAVWIQEYLYYRLNRCDHLQGATRVMQQIDGLGVQPAC